MYVTSTSPSEDKKNAGHSSSDIQHKWKEMCCAVMWYDVIEGSSEQKETAVLISHSILGLQIWQKYTAMQTDCQGSSNALEETQAKEEFEALASLASKWSTSGHIPMLQRISSEWMNAFFS